MRTRSGGVVLAAMALILVPSADGAFASLAVGESPAAEAPSDAEPHPVEPPTIPGPQRRVDVEMKDHVFAPAALDVKLGETVTFVFKNTGKAVHDAFLGDKAAQDHHEKEMRSTEGEHDHAGAEDAVTVHPGETAAMRYQFDKLGDLEIGCHQPGHYRLGMTIQIRVTPV